MSCRVAETHYQNINYGHQSGGLGDTFELKQMVGSHFDTLKCSEYDKN